MKGEAFFGLCLTYRNYHNKVWMYLMKQVLTGCSSCHANDSHYSMISIHEVVCLWNISNKQWNMGNLILLFISLSKTDTIPPTSCIVQVRKYLEFEVLSTTTSTCCTKFYRPFCKCRISIILWPCCTFMSKNESTLLQLKWTVTPLLHH